MSYHEDIELYLIILWICFSCHMVVTLTYALSAADERVSRCAFKLKCSYESATEPEKVTLEDEYKEHIRRKDRAREEKHRDKLKENRSSWHAVIRLIFKAF